MRKLRSCRGDGRGGPEHRTGAGQWSRNADDVIEEMDAEIDDDPGTTDVAGGPDDTTRRRKSTGRLLRTGEDVSRPTTVGAMTRQGDVDETTERRSVALPSLGAASPFARFGTAGARAMHPMPSPGTSRHTPERTSRSFVTTSNSGPVRPSTTSTDWKTRPLSRHERRRLPTVSPVEFSELRTGRPSVPAARRPAGSSERSSCRPDVTASELASELMFHDRQ